MTAKAETKTASVKLLVGVPAIEKAMQAVGRKEASLDKDIHVLACSVLDHVNKHREVSLLVKLLAPSTLSERNRKNALRAWFETFGLVSFDGNDPVFDGTKKPRLGDAMAKPFWKFKPEPVYVPMDVPAALASFIKKLETDQSKVEGRDHKAIIATLRKLTPANTVAA